MSPENERIKALILSEDSECKSLGRAFLLTEVKRKRITDIALFDGVYHVASRKNGKSYDIKHACSLIEDLLDILFQPEKLVVALLEYETEI